MTEIVLANNGSIATRPEDASHLIEWDAEVDDLPRGKELSEDFIRTLEIRMQTSPELVLTAAGPLVIGGVALVHWFYFPDSYDEWYEMIIFHSTNILNLY